MPTTAVRPTIRMLAAATAVVVSIDSVTISGIGFIVGAVPSDGVFGGAISVLATSDVIITGILVQMHAANECVREGTGVYIKDSQRVVVSDSRFDSLQVCAQGGGVLVSGGLNVQILRCNITAAIITETTGLGGAGLYHVRGSLVYVNDTRFVGLSAGLRDGGAVYGAGLIATPTIAHFHNCLFDRNDGIDGGSVYELYSQSTYTNCTFSNGFSSGSAGAVFLYIASTVFRDCHFLNNVGQNGGAIYTQQARVLEVYNGAFVGNSAQVGGAVEMHSSQNPAAPLTFAGVTFDSNRASESASIMLIKDTIGAIRNSTFKLNSCSSGGGMVLDGTSTGTVDTSIFTDNDGELGAGMALFTTTRVVVTSSQFYRNSASSTGGAINVLQTSGFDGTDLSFANNYAESTGGAIYTFGTVSVNLTRASFNGDTTNYGGGCVYADFETTLRVADSALTDCLTVTGEGGGMYLRQTTTAAIANTVFRRNTGALGGGIFATGSVRTTITGCLFQGNGAVSDGGGLYMERESVHSISDSSFTANYAVTGGALNAFGTTTVRVRNCTFTNHTASSSAPNARGIDSGGAIECSVSGHVTVQGCAFVNNRAVAVGGSLHTTSCMFNVSDSYFVNSTAGTFGGAVYVDYQSVILSSNFTRNSALWGGAVFFLADPLTPSPYMNVGNCIFDTNWASGAGGALYWESIAPAYIPSCVGCVYHANGVGGYGPNEATAASIIEIIHSPATDSKPASPPDSIDASQSFEVHVVIRDYFGAIYAFYDPRARRITTAEATAAAIPVGSQNATVIGSTLVTVVDGYADFTGIFLRGSQTRLRYNVVLMTTPASTVTLWPIFLEPCEVGFAQVPDPIFLFECIECPSGQFDIARTSYCLNCKKGAICEGLNRIFALRNWWWDPKSSDTNPQFYQCIPDRCCPISDPGNRCQRTRPCAEGWNQNSTLCSKCLPGSYEWNNRCIECSTSNKWRFSLVFFIAGVLVAILFGMGSKIGGELRIFIFFCQAIVIIVGPVHQTMPYFGISHGLLDVLSIDNKCFIRLTPFEKLIAQFTVPVLLLGLLTFVSGVSLIIKFWRRELVKRQAHGEHVPHVPLASIINAYINLLGICTVPLLHTSFQLLVCRRIGDTYVLNLAPDVRCYRGQHLKWLGVAVFVAVFYSFILPFLVFFYRRASTLRLLQKRFWQRDLSFLTHHIYLPHMFWWEILLVGRDVLLVSNYVLWFAEPERRVVAVMMVLFLFLFAHAYGMPFRDKWDNAVEMLVLVCLAYSAFLVHYPYRFQIAAVARDAWIRDIMLFTGLAIGGGFVFLRLGFDLVAPALLPLYNIKPVQYDVHHTAHI